MVLVMQRVNGQNETKVAYRKYGTDNSSVQQKEQLARLTLGSLSSSSSAEAGSCPERSSGSTGSGSTARASSGEISFS